MPLKNSTETKMGCQLSGWAVRVGEGLSLILKTSLQRKSKTGGPLPF